MNSDSESHPKSTLRQSYRLRGDLEWSEREDTNEGKRWILIDALRAEYYFLNELERTIAIATDGRRSIEEIVALVLPTHPKGDAIPFVRTLIQRFDAAGLLLAGSGIEMDGASRQRFRVRETNNLMGFKLPVFDPSPWIPCFGSISYFLFSWPFLAVVFVASLVVGIQILSNMDVLISDLQFATVVSMNQVFFVGCILLFCKVFHEMGHALAGYRFGATCREIGVYFFIGIPCFYCDMSDSWRIKDKWSRMLVAAAGIYFEWIIAILAGIAWSSSHLLWVRVCSVQIMVACSLTTLLFNANPLMRYDGYFAVCDYLGIVNLMERARNQWSMLWSSWIMRREDEPMALQSNILYVCYYLLSTCYRWFLIGSLLLGMYAWFHDERMRVLGNIVPLLLAAVLLLQLFSSARFLISRMANQTSDTSVRWPSVFVFGMIGCAITYGLLFWRSNEVFLARATIEPDGLIPVFLPHDATVIELLPDGAVVSAGDRVAKADSFELNDELLRLRGELQLCQVRKNHWEKRSIDEPSLVQSIAELNHQLSGLRDQVALLEKKVEQLTITAASDGVFSASLSVPWDWKSRTNVSTERIDLHRITNRGMVLQRGALLGTIEQNPDKSTNVCIRAYVREKDVSKIGVGDAVTIYVEQLDDVLRGAISRIGNDPVRELPQALQNDGLYKSSLQGTRAGTNANEYLVTIEVMELDRSLLRGGLATVRLEGKRRTMLELAWSLIRR